MAKEDMELSLSPFNGDDETWQTQAIVDDHSKVLMFMATSKYGELYFGVRSDGHRGWWFKEQGGGGAVTVMYSRDNDGNLLVALRNEMRPNMGGARRWCIPGGFIRAGESHVDAQAREALDETGVDTQEAYALPGLPFISNRAFFVANPIQGEGIHAYALQVPFTQLRETEDGYELTTHIPDFKEQEHFRFFEWREAVKKTADGIALAAIAQLLAAEL
jgi:ADP-ribose pyrophosphatase YjhB (NUDIX family)